MSVSIELPKIGVSSKTIQDCFTDCIYSVPEFQRPYSWEQDQLEDYWRDVIEAQGDLFFGTIVTWISERRELFRDTHALIDGQQRLTTSSIALSVVRDALRKMSNSHSGQDTREISSEAVELALTLQQASQRYLLAEDDYGKKYPIVHRPEHMFWEVIQQPNSIPSNSSWDESARRIGEARVFFEERILALSGTAATSDDAVERLERARKNILRARLIQVELEKEEDAFLIFETLNTRGAELQLRDLVKNDLIRRISDDSHDRQSVASRWDDLMTHVVPADAPIEAADNFIWQSWNSRRVAVRKNELYKEIRSLLGEDAGASLSFLEELETDAIVYGFLEGENTDFPAAVHGARRALSVPEVQDTIGALEIFNVSVANSAVLALVRKYDNCSFMTRKNLVRAVRAIENFHFQFTQLATSSSTGGTRKRYNGFAVELEGARNASEVTSAVSDLVRRLQASVPKREIVVSAFKQLFYAPSVRLTQKQKKFGRADLIRYVLMTLAKATRTIPQARNVTGWTIEHIRPQEQANGKVGDPVYSIGNLTILTTAANGELSNKPISEKRASLKRTTALRDTSLESWLEDASVELSDSQIAERASSLAELAVDEVWAV